MSSGLLLILLISVVTSQRGSNGLFGGLQDRISERRESGGGIRDRISDRRGDPSDEREEDNDPFNTTQTRTKTQRMYQASVTEITGDQYISLQNISRDVLRGTTANIGMGVVRADPNLNGVNHFYSPEILSYLTNPADYLHHRISPAPFTEYNQIALNHRNNTMDDIRSSTNLSNRYSSYLNRYSH